VSADNARSTPQRFTFTITPQPTAPVTPATTTQEICGDGIDNNRNGQIDENCPIIPTIRLTDLVDGFYNRISTSRPTTSLEYMIEYDARGQMLNRWCTANGDGSLPVGIRYDSNVFRNCNEITPHRDQAVVGYGSRVQNTGQKWSCAVVFDQTNTPSRPACASWEVVRLARGPPIAVIEFQGVWPPNQNDYAYLPYRGNTPHDNAFFWYEALERTETGRRALFDCRWDDGPWQPCGILPFHRLTCRAPTTPTAECFYHRNAERGYDQISSVGEGQHSLTVRARYIDSEPGPQTRFIWCVTRTDSCVHSPQTFRPIVYPGLQGNMISGINQSFFLPNASVNNIIIEKETAKLSGSICDWAVTNALKEISYAKDKDNSDNQTLHTQLAKEYLSECPASYQYPIPGNLTNGLSFANGTEIPYPTEKNIPMVTSSGNELISQDKVIGPGSGAESDKNTDSPVSKGENSDATTEGGTSKDGGESTVDTNEPVGQDQKQEAGGSGTEDDTSASKIDKDEPSLEDSKPNCRVGETFTEEGCAPS